jgi:hypothetical protein
VRNAGAEECRGLAARLAVGSEFVTVAAPVAYLGTLAPGDSVAASFPVTASSRIRPGSWVACTLYLSADSQLPDTVWPTAIRIGSTAGPTIVTIDTGSVLLTVADHGSLAYDELVNGRGRGFRVPKEYPSSIRYASFAVGNSPEYVVDHYYTQPSDSFTDHDWVCIESLQMVLPAAPADEHWRGRMSDVGHSRPTGLVVDQDWYALAQPGFKALWVIGLFRLTNHADTALLGLYAGLLVDISIPPFADSNYIYLDTVRRAAYARCKDWACPTAGITLLEPDAPAALAAVNNAVWILPDSCVTDSQKYGMLTGAIAERAPAGLANWSATVSAGPFDLLPGTTSRVAFAVVGHTSPANWLTAADTARAWYERNFLQVGTGEKQSASAPASGILIRPAIARSGSRIRVSIPSASSLHPSLLESLSLYSCSGARVRTFAVRGPDFEMAVGSLPAGLYFLRLSSAGRAGAARLTISR